MIDQVKWKWFGVSGHFICGKDCRFHLCTQIGDHLISTVGEYFPDESIREIFAQSRGVCLEGKGDIRRADYMEKVGYEEIGMGRTYETMVFKIDGEKKCELPDCNCGLPTIIPNELDFESYNQAGDATKGHAAMCLKWADK